MLAKALCAAVLGVDAFVVEVEVDIVYGLPAFTTVGLPEIAVKESRERVKSAIVNSGYEYPDDRITVNLAPADVKKEGTAFDLPMALGILAAGKEVPLHKLSKYLIMGELSLDGRIKPVKGVLSAALAARDAGLDGVVTPRENGPEAAVVEGIPVYPAGHLSVVVDFLSGRNPIPPLAVRPMEELGRPDCRDADFMDVVGQHQAKRALTVAAAGGHNVIMTGPPGSGKTMLARRLPSILPGLTLDEAIETTKIYSVSGKLPPNRALVTTRPFRSPHHTISDAGLIGGGHIPRPGEVSLAHNGVLFLDELPEFRKNVLEALRQPMEDRRVTISRAATSVTFPSRFMLVAAMNPCPCGYNGDVRNQCECTPHAISRYRTRLSGPLLDRFDIHLMVPAVAYKEFRQKALAEPSADIQARVAAARNFQLKRFKRTKIVCNAQMTSRQLRNYCGLDNASENLLEAAVNRMGFSARGVHRILKVARTIADMEGAAEISGTHLSEAVQYRSLDRKLG